MKIFNSIRLWHHKSLCTIIIIRGGVEDTRLEAKDTKKLWNQGQGLSFRGQTLSRPRTGMLEAKAKDQGHKRKCSPKKKGLHKNLSGDLHKKTFSKKFFKRSTKFNNSKNSAVLEPRTGQFLRTWSLEAKDFKMYPRERPRGQGRPQGLHLWLLSSKSLHNNRNFLFLTTLCWLF